jgi:hypothetical protein
MTGSVTRLRAWAKAILKADGTPKRAPKPAPAKPAPKPAK